MEVAYKVRPDLTSDELNGLLESVWDDHEPSDLSNVLARSLTYIGAYADDQLIGYVNVAWDGANMHSCSIRLSPGHYLE